MCTNCCIISIFLYHTSKFVTVSCKYQACMEEIAMVLNHNSIHLGVIVRHCSSQSFLSDSINCNDGIVNFRLIKHDCKIFIRVTEE